MHGSIFNSNPDQRHAGDLINNLKSDNSGKCYICFHDSLTSLYSDDTGCIVGRSIVIHQDTDDLGREGMAQNIPYLVNKNGQTMVIQPNITRPFTRYTDPKKREASKKNGNAGKRIACANLTLTE